MKMFFNSYQIIYFALSFRGMVIPSIFFVCISLFSNLGFVRVSHTLYIMVTLVLCPQVLHWLWPLPELVPWALCWHLTERGQPHRCLRLSAMSVNRRCHDSPHTTYRQRLRWVEKNITLFTSMSHYHIQCLRNSFKFCLCVCINF